MSTILFHNSTMYQMLTLNFLFFFKINIQVFLNQNYVNSLIKYQSIFFFYLLLYFMIIFNLINKINLKDYSHLYLNNIFYSD